MSLPGFLVNMHEAKMTVYIFSLAIVELKKQLHFFSPLRESVKVKDLLSAKFILISSCWDVSLAPWSATIGSGLERRGGCCFNVNRTLKNPSRK